MGLRQGDLEARGGPSNGTVRNIEQAARDKYASRTFVQLEQSLDWPDGIVDRILDGSATQSEINEVVVRDTTPAALNLSLTPVRLVSPDGRDYVSRSPTDINNLIYGHGYQLREPHPDWPNIAVAEPEQPDQPPKSSAVSGKYVKGETGDIRLSRAPEKAGDLTVAAWLIERLERRYAELKPSEMELHQALRAALSDLPSRPPQ